MRSLVTYNTFAARRHCGRRLIRKDRRVRCPEDAFPYAPRSCEYARAIRKLEGAILIIATWNVNSVRQRLPHLLDYLGEVGPDVLCLQEIKCVAEAFPREEIEALGYNIAIHGQKGFNGVALLSKRPFETVPGLPGDPTDEQARYIEGVIPTDNGGAVRVASLYLPNGNPVGTEKYTYKLAFMDRLDRRMRGGTLRSKRCS